MKYGLWSQICVLYNFGLVASSVAAAARRATMHNNGRSNGDRPQQLRPST